MLLAKISFISDGHLSAFYSFFLHLNTPPTDTAVENRPRVPTVFRLYYTLRVKIRRLGVLQDFKRPTVIVIIIMVTVLYIYVYTRGDALDTQHEASYGIYIVYRVFTSFRKIKITRRSRRQWDRL